MVMGTVRGGVDVTARSRPCNYDLGSADKDLLQKPFTLQSPALRVADFAMPLGCQKVIQQDRATDIPAVLLGQARHELLEAAIQPIALLKPQCEMCIHD